MPFGDHTLAVQQTFNLLISSLAAAFPTPFIHCHFSHADFSILQSFNLCSPIMQFSTVLLAVLAAPICSAIVIVGQANLYISESSNYPVP